MPVVTVNYTNSTSQEKPLDGLTGRCGRSGRQKHVSLISIISTLLGLPLQLLLAFFVPIECCLFERIPLYFAGGFGIFVVRQ